jgi:hypothetical protein
MHPSSLDTISFQIAFQTVASMEVLADISADVAG